MNSNYFLFVNLGKDLPTYLTKNIDLIKRTFGDHKVLVVVDEPINLFKLSNIGVTVYRYERKKSVSNLLHGLTLDHAFRNGFWQLTIDRLFAICDVVEKLGLSSVLYIESDVLLLPNFPLTDVWSLKGLAWPRYNHLRDVPALIHIETPAHAELMSSELLRLFSSNSDLTDMSALHALAETNKEIVNLLPTIKEGLENRNLVTRQEFRRASRIIHSNSDSEGGIFDGASIGMFLTGQDPRNTYGFTMYLNPELSLPNESYLNLNQTRFEQESDRLYIRGPESKRIEIYNLHIHSKNDEAFFASTEKFLANLIKRANLGTTYLEFKPKIFLTLLRENFQQGTLIRYCYGLIRFLFRVIKKGYTLNLVQRDKN